MASISGATWGTGFYCPFMNKEEHRTHQFIEFIHLCKDWQVFSSFEDLVILRGMWQTSEWIFVALLQWLNEI
jgi:hypothetical protein